MRARVFKLGMLLLLVVPILLSLGLASWLAEHGAMPCLLILIALPLTCMAGAGLLPED